MSARTGIKIKSHTILSVMILIFCLSLCFGIMKMTAYADNGDFRIDAHLLPSDGETFDIRVTVENMGDDWEGVARLKVGGSYGNYDECAYDTAISLPQDSVKQFVVKVPKYSYSPANLSGRIGIFLIDKNSQSVFSKEFDKLLLLEKKDALNMGILSDDYSSLAFMDMGGDKLKFYGDWYPVKLVELNQDNLSDSLESLEILVIDKYDTGILTADEAAAIEEWNKGGGVLVVGTGGYAEDTLAGLDYLDVEYKGMYDAEDNPYYGDGWLGMDELEIAELACHSCYEDSHIAALTISIGDGAMGVLMYSLSELGGLDGDGYGAYKSDFVYEVLDNICVYSTRRYGAIVDDLNYNSVYNSESFLSILGNGSVSWNFGLLKVIIVIYVILIGPAYYLILRYIKKRDLYWVAVPALALIGVFIVMFVGRGLEIARTRVYSVTVCNLSEPDDCMTYMHCYDAGHAEWKLCLSQDYEYAAPTTTYARADGACKYRVLKEGEKLFFGADPYAVFEDVYFYAGKKADMQSMGSIDCNVSLYAFDTGRINKVANNTGYDFEYIAVLDDDYIWVYEGPAAGETFNPVAMNEIFKINKSKYHYFTYDYLYALQGRMKDGNYDILAALGAGINSAYYRIEEGEAAVVGIAPDYIKAVDDDCSEEAYGCFYTIVRKYEG